MKVTNTVRSLAVFIISAFYLRLIYRARMNKVIFNQNIISEKMFDLLLVTKWNIR